MKNQSHSHFRTLRHPSTAPPHPPDRENYPQSESRAATPRYSLVAQALPGHRHCFGIPPWRQLRHVIFDLSLWLFYATACGADARPARAFAGGLLPAKWLKYSIQRRAFSWQENSAPHTWRNSLVFRRCLLFKAAVISLLPSSRESISRTVAQSLMSPRSVWTLFICSSKLLSFGPYNGAKTSRVYRNLFAAMRKSCSLRSEAFSRDAFSPREKKSLAIRRSVRAAVWSMVSFEKVSPFATEPASSLLRHLADVLRSIQLSRTSVKICSASFRCARKPDWRVAACRKSHLDSRSIATS